MAKREIPREIKAAAETAVEKGMTMRDALEMFKYSMIKNALSRADNSQAEASRMLGTQRQNLGNALLMLERRLA